MLIFHFFPSLPSNQLDASEALLSEQPAEHRIKNGPRRVRKQEGCRDLNQAEPTPT